MEATRSWEFSFPQRCAVGSSGDRRLRHNKFHLLGLKAKAERFQWWNTMVVIYKCCCLHSDTTGSVRRYNRTWKTGTLSVRWPSTNTVPDLMQIEAWYSDSMHSSVKSTYGFALLWQRLLSSLQKPLTDIGQINPILTATSMIKSEVSYSVENIMSISLPLMFLFTSFLPLPAFVEEA